MEQTHVRCYRVRGDDFRLQVSTGTTNVDRYVALTNLAVMDNGTNADILALNVLN